MVYFAKILCSGPHSQWHTKSARHLNSKIRTQSPIFLISLQSINNVGYNCPTLFNFVVCVCVCVCVRACVTEYDHCGVLGTVDKICSCTCTVYKCIVCLPTKWEALL